jgi:hypothetical protein
LADLVDDHRPLYLFACQNRPLGLKIGRYQPQLPPIQGCICGNQSIAVRLFAGLAALRQLSFNDDFYICFTFCCRCNCGSIAVHDFAVISLAWEKTGAPAGLAACAGRHMAKPAPLGSAWRRQDALGDRPRPDGDPRGESVLFVTAPALVAVLAKAHAEGRLEA